MTHSIDFEGIEEKLFLIQQIVLGSRAYCEDKHIGRSLHPYGEGAWADYSSRLQSLISSYTIDCAIKTRMAQDFIMANGSDVNLSDVDEESREGYNIGTVHKGNITLTLRESCNKIIHATRVDLSWVETRLRRSKKKIEHWNGGYNLHGKHGALAWHVELDMLSWAVAMETFHTFLNERVDWYRVYGL